jgi:adenylyltransferase/sulfurtransferase
MTKLTDQEFLRYSRHFLLKEIGLEGQKKLKESSVLLIGTGGLGSPVALYLAAAGIGRIGLVDYDRVEMSNLQRQIIHQESTVGVSKVLSAQKRLAQLSSQIKIETYNTPFRATNALQIATEYDLIVDGSDNFPTRYLSNDVAVFLGIPNIYGSIYQFDGQASVFYAKEGPCYRCIFPTPPPAHLTPSCAEGGVLGALPGTIGSIQATEAIKMLLGIGSPLIGKLLLYNALEMSFDYVKLKKNPRCPVCGENPTITEPIDYDRFCGTPVQHADKDEKQEISVKELAELRKHAAPVLLDVRESHELAISSLPNAINIPLEELAKRSHELDPSREIVIFCRVGKKSRRALEILRNLGFYKLKNLTGGINRWAKEIDSSLRVY